MVEPATGSPQGRRNGSGQPSGPGSALTDRATSRRRFLALLGSAAATVPLGARLVRFQDEALAEDVSTGQGATSAKHQWAMVIDLRVCDGCGRCTDACQEAHSLAPDQTWIKVYEMRDAAGETFYMPRPCMQCENPPCISVCPVGATFRTDEGVTLVDQSRCIGCRMCMAACPYEARYFNWTAPPAPARISSQPMPEFPVPQQQGTVGKCVFCVHLTDYGKLPACVEGCPMGAIYIGDFVQDVAVNQAGDTVRLSQFLRDNDAVRFKEELGTNPRVYYILGHGQDLGY